MRISSLISAIAAGSLLLVSPAVIEAQQCAGGRVQGTLFDPAHAAIPGADVSLQAGFAAPVITRSDEQGHFVFRCVSASRYVVRVRAPGFRMPESRVQVSAGATQQLDLHLAIAAVETSVEVGEDATSLDPDHGAGTHTLTGKDVQDLADDPDDFKRQLQVLAATSGGAPGQATITVDGFMNGSQLPPKSSIASIRVNPDMFSSEYEEPPYRGGRIEIYTKPGLDLLHGALFFSDSDPSLNANDPYSVAGTPAAKRRYGFELSGPIVRRKSDFALALEKRDIDEFNVVNALVLGPGETPAALHQSVRAPQRLWIASARGDWQWRLRNIATVAYSANVSSLDNQGVGGLSLQEAGYSTTISEQNLRLTNIATLSPNLLHETRIGYTWRATSDTPNSRAASLQVAGAFTGGGATSQGLNDRERDLEVDDDLLITHGKHSIKFGVESLGSFVHATDPDTFNGAFLFGGGVSAPNLVAQGAPASGTAIIDGLEQYRRALAGLPGGTPTTYQLTSGTALVPFMQWRLATYAQDAWKLNPHLSVSLGLRYALETSPSSFADFAPRVGLAWSPDKKQKWVIHLRAGLFSSPVSQATTLDAYRLNGTRQLEQLIYAPSYTTPLTATGSSLTVATTHTFAAHAGESPSFQSQAGVERDLPHHWHVQANVFYAEAWDALRSRNINAPLIAAATKDPLHAPRPGAANANIFQYQQTGNLHGTVTFLGVDQHSYKRFGIFVGYLHYDLLTDADSSGQFPQSSYSDRGEMAHANWESTNRVFAVGQISLPYEASLSTQFDAASGVPYNVVTGTDTNGDGIFNDRPSYASAAGQGVYATRFGLLSSTTSNGDLPRNAGTLPANVHLDMNLSRAFAVGRGKGDRHETLTLNARSANLINHTNVVAVGTVLGSPTFGQALAAETARRLEVGARFTF